MIVAVNHSLSSPYPAHLIDIKKAIVWVKKHIHAYHGDASCVCIAGSDSGAHLAAMAALTANDPYYQPGFESEDTSVSACIALNGAYDLTNQSNHWSFAIDQWFSKEILCEDKISVEVQEFMQASSPLHLLKLMNYPIAPPFLIIHTSADVLFPARCARELHRLLKKKTEKTHCYLELSATNHFFDHFMSCRTFNVANGIHRFLSELLS
jgi:acetyl esterase/lipase